MIRVAYRLLLVAFDLGEFRVHHFLVLLAGVAARSTSRGALTATGRTAALGGLRLRVHHLAELLRGLGQLFSLAFELFLGRILLLEQLFGALHRVLDLALF